MFRIVLRQFVEIVEKNLVDNKFVAVSLIMLSACAEGSQNPDLSYVVLDSGNDVVTDTGSKYLTTFHDSGLDVVKTVTVSDASVKTVDSGHDANVVVSAVDAGIDVARIAVKDAAVNVVVDAGVDVKIATTVDAGVDSGIDAGQFFYEAGVYSPNDAGVYVRIDSGTYVDAGVDTGSRLKDAGPFWSDCFDPSTVSSGLNLLYPSCTQYCQSIGRDSSPNCSGPDGTDTVLIWCGFPGGACGTAQEYNQGEVLSCFITFDSVCLGSSSSTLIDLIAPSDAIYSDWAQFGFNCGTSLVPGSAQCCCE